MKQITILIKNLNHGGAEKVCVTLCNELIQRNHAVDLWILDYRNTPLAEQLNSNVQITNLKKQNVRKGFFQLIKLFFKNRPYKLLVFNIELVVLSIFIKKMFFFKTEIVFRSINTLSRTYQFPVTFWEKHLAIRTMRFVLPFCDKIVAQSNGMRNDLIQTFGISEKKIFTIPNPAVNLLPVNSKTTVLNQRKNDFLFVGRLQPQKGLTNLINIFARAHEVKPDLRLIILGDGPEERKLKTMTDSLGLNSAVLFEGYQTDTVSYFIKAKATVLTSIYEGFPNVLVESIAAGTPVIAYNCPSGPEDIVVPGVNGLLVPDQDMDAFTEAILAVANNEIQFEKQMITDSIKKFSVQSVVNKYEQVLSLA